MRFFFFCLLYMPMSSRSLQTLNCVMISVSHPNQLTAASALTAGMDMNVITINFDNITVRTIPLHIAVISIFCMYIMMWTKQFWAVESLVSKHCASSMTKGHHLWQLWAAALGGFRDDHSKAWTFLFFSFPHCVTVASLVRTDAMHCQVLDSLHLAIDDSLLLWQWIVDRKQQHLMTALTFLCFMWQFGWQEAVRHKFPRFWDLRAR